MQRLEVSCVVRPIYGSLGVRRLNIRHLVSIVNQLLPHLLLKLQLHN